MLSPPKKILIILCYILYILATYYIFLYILALLIYSRIIYIFSQILHLYYTYIFVIAYPSRPILISADFSVDTG